MGKIRKLAKDTALLTLAGLVMRCIGMAYQAWLAGRISAAGIGLWQLVMSVNILAATLAISGIRFTTTRLVSEVLGSGRSGCLRSAVRRCLLYAGMFGCAAMAVLYFGAERIGFLWIGDARTVACLRVIAFTMPLISLSSVMNGYYIASGHAWKSAVVQVLEQLVNVGMAIFLLRGCSDADLESCCVSVSKANLTADAVSLALVSILYLRDQINREKQDTARGMTGRMLRIAVPLAFSAYARTGLTTLEHLLIPKKLRAAGFSANQALTGYGTITGMVFPVLSFPSCVLGSAAELIVPELTASQVKGDYPHIRRAVKRLLRGTLLYSSAVALLLFVLADPLCEIIYHSREAGHYLRILAPLVPIMYMDIITDGCLKGLGQMLWSMGFNISEALIGVLLVVTVLPKKALAGYIFILYLCELFNFSLSFGRLYQMVKSDTKKHRLYKSADASRKVKLRPGA